MLEIPIRILDDSPEGIFVTDSIPEGLHAGKLILEIIPDESNQDKVEGLRVRIRVGKAIIAAEVARDFWPMFRTYVKLRGGDLPRKNGVIDLSDL